MMSESRRIVTGFFFGRENLPISAPVQSRTGGTSEKSMSWSLFAAMARMSRFCSFVSFLIGSPFMRLSSTSRNDTDDFFALFLIESMDDQQNRTGAYGSNGYPPLLFRSEVALGKSIGI